MAHRLRKTGVALAIAVMISVWSSAAAMAQDAANGGAPTARAAGERTVAADADVIELDVSMKVEFGTHRFATRQAMLVKSNKTATTTTTSDDAKDPIRCSFTVHPTLREGNTVQLQMKVVVHAGNEDFSRTVDVTSPLLKEGEFKDEGKTAAFELKWVAKPR